jgi:hypothetical protein
VEYFQRSALKILHKSLGERAYETGPRTSWAIARPVPESSSAPLHSCSLLIPALLSTASIRPTPTEGADFLLAAIIGFEVGPRVGYTLHGASGSVPRLPDLILDIITSGGVMPGLAAQGYLPAEFGELLRSSAVAMRGEGSGA